MKKFSDALLALLLIVALAYLPACNTTSGAVAVGWGAKGGAPSEAPPHPGRKHGPPAHAPAWGYRAKHQYWYYPEAFVYFDVTRKVYFYMEGPNWHMAVSLPSYYKANLGGYVVLEMDTDTPYTYFDRHKKKYPPGQWKKGKKKKGKGWH